uniref:Uncharacterized protein n=1 Tax=Melopsittacus undulatus TaxID=13146 RepID=A0A8C6IZL5_MELUD
MGRYLTMLLLLVLLVQHFGNCEGNQRPHHASPMQFTQAEYNATVYENSAAKTYVGHPVKMGIYVTNPLWDLRYKIISGDSENLFKAEEYVLGNFCFLRIRTKGGNTAILNREVKDHYTLTVKAVEKYSNAETRTKVRIQVLDTNDLRPLFSPTSYSVSLPENTAVRTSIARVSATDADIGTNGEFYYSFKERTDVFAIHPTSGVVVLTGRLDYSDTKHYEMEILAVDRGLKLYGSSGISSMAKLTVYVEQANEYAPIITVVTLTPSESDKDPTFAIVTVEDNDQGSNGEIASLNIVAGDPLQQFKTVRSVPGGKEYRIKAIGHIDWESHPFGYNLTLQAKDKGNPPQFSSVKVVHVTSPQFKSGPVRFEKEIYRAEISEFAPPNTPVIMVKALPSYPHLTYIFKNTPGKLKFNLNAHTGLITTAEPIKAQYASHFELEVATSDRRASAKVLIKVLGMNSNPPEFTQTSYKASFDENVPVGTSVMRVSAKDPDEGENGYVTYSIANLNPLPFVINHFSGIISTSEDLDYELMPRVYNLRIRASDWGVPYRREVEVPVTIILNNLNDNIPLFEKINCEGTIPRDLGVGEQITTVSAIDADELQLVRYQIESGNELDLFSLNPNSGVLSLKQSLIDGLGAKVSFHSLRITATDGENFANPLYINITVATTRKPVNLQCEETGVAKMLAEKLLQANKLHSRGEIEDVFFDTHSVNLHAPQFKSTLPTSIEIREDQPVGSRIMLMNATDLDTGFNGKLVYVISGGNEDSSFIVDMERGVLKILSPLDREVKDKYTLNITVYDLGIPQKSAWHLLDIKILDANDNPPEFLQDSYFIEVSENKEPNSEIIQIEATDKDLGVNGEVKYSLLTDTDKFTINAVTGIVKVVGILDREEQHVYFLKIEARDQPTEEPQLFSTVILKVSVEDVNDNPPKFIPSNYHVRIREDLPEGTIITWLEAYDPDLGQSSQIRYSLLDSGDGTFDVDKLSGAIRIVERLDYEKKQFYNLTVRAKDKGKPISLSSTCYIEVEIVDVNENLHTPRFSIFADKGFIKEDAPVGSSVIAVSAYDEDAGRDGEIKYSIRDGSGIGVFRIDEEKGIIETADRLDRETTSHYWLTVYATDQGVVPLSSFIEIYIEVGDVNDNAPQTTKPVYYPEVMENSPKDVSVIQIEAFDPDSSSSEKLTYKITSGNPQGFFSINPKTGKCNTVIYFMSIILEVLYTSFLITFFFFAGNIGNSFSLDPILGMIKTAKELDRSNQEEYNLMVKATDKGDPPMSEVTSVHIFVTVSDNASPKFTAKEYSAEISESASVGSFVGMVTAYSQSSVVFEIKDGNIGDAFAINPNSGVIVSQKVLDFETLPVYTLTVQGTNMAGLSTNATVLVHLRDENDNPPVFMQAEYTGLISESASINSVVLTDKNIPLVIRATDADKESNALLVYEIVEPSVRKYFAIDSSTGAIWTVMSLDYEETNIFHFSVQVHDMGIPHLYAEYAANVTIYVIDINDCPPVFSRELYETSVLIPTYKGVEVISVNATDADSGIFSQLIYSIVEGNIGEKFSINPKTGHITVQNTTQLRSRYELTVRASDGRFASTAAVKINVKESKASQLKFTQSSYSATVQENSTEAKTIAVVTAIGNQINEPLFYHILNPDNRFKISPTSGVLSTTGIPFDREQQESFDVVIEVTEEYRPSVVAHIVVRVTVEDVNDNAPFFVSLPYYAVVKVDSEAGHVIQRVTAVDKDTGRNGEVHYYLKEHYEHFQIDPTGEISLKKKFEPDTLNKEYLVTVVAKDGGDPPFSAEVTVPITVMSKAMPVFEKPFYSAEIPENIQLHSPVVHVQANSPEGFKVFYSITGGDPFNQFTINFNTGVINVVALLDFESHPAYKLSVRATDSLTGAHADVFVDIIVEDINDNHPVFTEQTYTATLSEASVIGTSVVQVSATDADSGTNRGISYHLVEDNSESHDYFHIDSSTGLILTARTLDYEQIKQHKLLIRAIDGGMLPLSSDTIVTVDVTNLNDNPPVFNQLLYEAKISELAPRGHFVTCVQASDADSLDVDKLEYSILTGNDQKNFVINSKTGIITISNLRRQTLKSHYNLNVSVSDGVFRSSAQVHVTVTSANMHSPVFSQNEYEVELAENAPLHTSVTEVKATDEDSGTYGHMTYHIVNDFAKDRFYTNERGQIFTSKKLDRETQVEKVIAISLMAKDSGGKVAFCTINVILTDVNDNAPQFRVTEYEVNIGSDVPRGTSVIKVWASDADEGTNADITYAIEAESENVKENLEIDSLSGIITTKESLIGLENEFLIFFVRAVDGGSPRKESVVPVYARILPPEVPLPKFSEPFYSYTVSEDIPIGTEIDVIKAEHNQTLVYSLIKGNTPESNRDAFFVIDRQTGHLKLDKNLDHETTKWYQFSVQAQYANEDYKVVSSVEVSIQVKDANDNRPVLESNPYEAFIVENMPAGTRVIQIKGTDLDSGLNGQVTYSLDPSQELDVIESFAINMETGWVTTLKELDHEKRDKYKVTVIASDRGEKVQLSSMAVVEVTVTDVNDNPPRFTAEIYKGTVSEDDPPDGVIAILSTTDADTEEANRQVFYYITGGDPLGQFAIENIQNEWKVYVKNPLDREEKDNYLLNITATDGTFATKAVVEVKVLDANDNSPVCEKALYTDSVPEDALPGKLIMQVSATDADIRSNAEITYTLHGTGAEKFRLTPDTGELKTLMPLDREQQAVYYLLMKATDGGGRFCQSNVILTLEDVNDNAPEFTADPYSITVFENTEPKTLLTRVQATDADAGMNRKIHYSLVSSAEGQFSIDEFSGIIRLEKPLDRELQAVYTLTLKATDEGLPRRLSSTSSLIVSVLDINDNPPVFEHREYSANVSEDILVGTEVLQIYAASRDIEANAEITYSIVSGNEHGKFSIDSTTGAIFVIESLDYESSHEYYLTVEATDGGTPSLSDVVTVNINVTDMNDNTPVFSQDTYTAVISEDAMLEQSVITVMADDADGPSNNRIHYAIIDGNQGNPFTIDPTRGEIKVTKLLDREKISGYTLTVQASDNGNPPRLNTTAVNIDVSDVNDNPPVFSKGNYSVIIQENKPVGFSVLQLVVTDKDSSHNGPPFLFTILSGNEENTFQITQQGVLTTGAALNRKVRDHYLLHVKVADNGKPPLSSLTYIDIRVIEESIYSPAILPLEIFITAFGEEYSGGVIGKIHATDQDVYDTLTYSLDPKMESLFSVSSTGGKLIAHKSLDIGQYLLNVTVTDGKFTTAADIAVHVRQITQDLLNHSIAIRFANLAPEEFIGDYWRNFQRALRNILGVRRNDIQIVSLQPSEPPSNLDVLLNIEKSGSSQYPMRILLHKINSSVPDLEEILGVRIIDVFHKLCAGLDCPLKFCEEKVTVDENIMSTHSTARLSFVTPRHHRTAVCLCKAGSAVTFTGSSYVKYRLMENENKEEMKLTMRLRTYSAHAVVMYARGTDYSILEIHHGRLQYKFDCGSGPGIVSVQSIQINDGQWHSVSLEVDGNYARLVLDRVHTASGTAPGTLRTLNLDNHVFFGGHIRQQGTRHGRSPQVSNGFRGCMDSVVLNGQELPLNSKPRNYAHMEESVDVTPGCLLTTTEGCSSSPCQNGGICNALSNGGYYCKCAPLFMGTHCDVSVNPCASNPCLYGGTCIPVKNPCLNGALCENTYGSYHCNCSHGFGGKHCTDIVLNKYVSTSWNISLAEVIGIIVFITGIFLLVVIFVVCRKVVSRKKKHQPEPEDKQLGNIYSDIPPQVPVRPISYTPSIPSDSRNNLDRNSFEGSAIPEHPEFSTFNPDSVHGHRKAVAVCSVAPNLPPPPPSNSPSDSDSIQKPSWDFDYDSKKCSYFLLKVCAAAVLL